MCRGPRKDCGWSVYVKNSAGAERERGHSAEVLAKMVTQLNELRWHWCVLAEKPSSKPKSDSKSHSTRPSPLVIQMRGLIIIISTRMIIPTATLLLRLGGGEPGGSQSSAGAAAGEGGAEEPVVRTHLGLWFVPHPLCPMGFYQLTSSLQPSSKAGVSQRHLPP